MCPHTAQCVRNFLTLHSVEVVPRAPCSPYLVPCDFFQFPTGKRVLEERHFESPQAALGAADTAFKHLARNGFKHVFDEWQWR